MTDLGFGLVDRRSVLVVLFAVLVSTILFGNQLPIDTTTVVGLFTSLAMLTGFVYLARIAGRIVIAAVYTVIRIPFDVVEAWRDGDWNSRSGRRWSDEENRKPVLHNSLRIIGCVLVAVLRGLGQALDYGMLYSLVSTDWLWSHPRLATGILGIFDRAVLVGIAYASTLRLVSGYIQPLGLAGLILLIVVFVFSGKFTFVLKDAFHKAEEEHDALVSAAGNHEPPSPT